ncbi:MAG TPA: UdgX family uracil-DNA binding protein [Kofleriaceae bacterium]
MPVVRRFQGAQRFLPVHRTLETLRDAAARCHGCPLYKEATHVVFGEGPADARAVFVGEVPGDYEDRVGHPFVGPAGRVLDEALATAGIDRKRVFMTNAVKHFKFTRRGKRRIHDKPSRYEVTACKPWLDAELELVEPDVVVVLGATAGQALFGPSFRIEPSRGHELESRFAPHTFATLHPAAVLRAPDHAMREIMKQRFFDDIALAAACLRA